MAWKSGNKMAIHSSSIRLARANLLPFASLTHGTQGTHLAHFFLLIYKTAGKRKKRLGKEEKMVSQSVRCGVVWWGWNKASLAKWSELFLFWRNEHSPGGPGSPNTSAPLLISFFFPFFFSPTRSFKMNSFSFQINCWRLFFSTLNCISHPEQLKQLKQLKERRHNVRRCLVSRSNIHWTLNGRIRLHKRWYGSAWLGSATLTLIFSATIPPKMLSNDFFPRSNFVAAGRHGANPQRVTH